MSRWLGSSRTVAAVSLCCLTAAFAFVLVAAVSQAYMFQIHYITESYESSVSVGADKTSSSFSTWANPLGRERPLVNPTSPAGFQYSLLKYPSLRGGRSRWYRAEYQRMERDFFSTGTTETASTIWIPHVWLVGSFLLAGLLTSPALTRGLRRRRRLARGGCPACGYDLRATPDRCPECGHVLPATPA